MEGILEVFFMAAAAWNFFEGKLFKEYTEQLSLQWVQPFSGMATRGLRTEDRPPTSETQDVVTIDQSYWRQGHKVLAVLRNTGRGHHRPELLEAGSQGAGCCHMYLVRGGDISAWNLLKTLDSSLHFSSIIPSIIPIVNPKP